MSAKYLNIRRITLPLLSFVILVSQVTGAACLTQDELLKELQVCREVEIEYVESVKTQDKEEESRVKITKSVKDSDIVKDVDELTVINMEGEDAPIKAQSESINSRKLGNIMRQMKKDKSFKEIQIDMSQSGDLESEVQGLFVNNTQARMARAIVAIERATGMKLR